MHGVELGAALPPASDTESLADAVRRLEAIARPVLVATLTVSTVDHVKVFKSDCSHHAKQLPPAAAPLAAWRAAQKDARMPASRL